MTNDMTIIGSIIIFFFILGASIPFINQAFGIEEQPFVDAEGIVLDIGDQMENSTSPELYENFVPTGGITIFKVIGSVFKMFFWGFGQVPLWINIAILWPLRILLALIIARNIWVGGGS